MKLLMLIICAAMGTVFGLLYALLMSLFGNPAYQENALFSGILFAISIYAMCILLDIRQRRQRKAAFARLPSAVVFAAEAFFKDNGKLHLTDVYLCLEQLCLIRVDQSGMPMESFPCRDITRAHMSPDNELTIFLTEDRQLQLRSSRAQELFRCLREQGWLPLQH